MSLSATAIPSDPGQNSARQARAQRIAWLFLLGVILAEGAPLVIVLARNRIRFLQLLGFLPGLRGNALAWAMAAGTTALFIAATLRQNPYIAQNWRRLSGMKLVAILMAVVSGIFEEIFFRRMVMDVAMHHGWSVMEQIALSAVVFGAAHGIWGLFGGGVRPALGATVATGMLGFLLATVYVAGGRALAPCIAAHFAINLVLEPWLVLAAALGHWGRTQNP